MHAACALRSTGIGLLLIACTARCDWQQAEQAYRQGDYVTALQAWRELATAGDDAAQYNTAILLLDGQGRSPDPQAAFDWLQRAVAQGNNDARFCLGYLYAQGEDVPLDIQRAAEWYRKAAAVPVRPWTRTWRSGG